MTRRLLIRPGAIGDCIVSFPALEFLKADYTEVWISSPAVPLVQFADCARSLSSTQLDLVGLDLEFPAQLARRLREFDEVVSWYGSNRAEFRKAMTTVQPQCIFLRALPDENWKEPAADFFLRQAGGKPGIVPRIHISEDHVTANHRRRSTVIHPFSGSATKNWPLEKYRELAEHLSVPVDWVAGPEENLEGANQFGNLMDLAHWMKGALLYMGNDSGISHLAAAIGLPTVALFGPTDPNIWGPRGEEVQILRHRPLSELAAERVIEEAEHLLRSAERASGKS